MKENENNHKKLFERNNLIKNAIRLIRDVTRQKKNCDLRLLFYKKYDRVITVYFKLGNNPIWKIPF